MKKDAMESEKANKLANYIGYLIQGGILINDIKLPFTMLDYYTLTKEDILYVARGVRNLKKDRSYFESLIISTFLKFANTNGYLYHIVNDINEVIDEHNCFIINNVRITPNVYDIEEIFNMFENYNIPKYDKLIYTALTRKAHGYPILPLIMRKEEEKTASR